MNHMGHQAVELEVQEGVGVTGDRDEAKILQTLG